MIGNKFILRCRELHDRHWIHVRVPPAIFLFGSVITLPAFSEASCHNVKKCRSSYSGTISSRLKTTRLGSSPKSARSTVYSSFFSSAQINVPVMSLKVPDTTRTMESG